MRLAGFIFALFLFMAWVVGKYTAHDNKVIQACVDKGGVVVNSMQGFVCVSREFLIKVEVE